MHNICLTRSVAASQLRHRAPQRSSGDGSGGGGSGSGGGVAAFVPDY